MATLHVHGEIFGEGEFSRQVKHMQHVVEDFRDLWEQMADDFWQHEQKVFDEEGPGWRPLAPSTRWNRMYQGYPPSHPILVRSGALKNSLTDGTADGAIYEVYPNELRLGTALKTDNGYTLGTLHQLGSMRVVDHPPKRPPVTITPELEHRWNRRLAEWVYNEFGYRWE